jgi:hypothetical protein
MPDRAPVSGVVIVDDASGRRVDAVGCAQLFLDDYPHPALDAAQRYNSEGGLPVPLELQNKTLTTGRFYFGNVKPGPHVLKVSMDAGQTFIAEKSFFVPIARQNASGAIKEILYVIDIDVGDLNPTPANCPDH